MYRRYWGNPPRPGVWVGGVYPANPTGIVDDAGMDTLYYWGGTMAMDRQQDQKQDDLVCVESQLLLRLLQQLWNIILEQPWVAPEGRDYRLATLCAQIRKIIEQASPCGHAQHLAYEPGKDGLIDGLIKVVNAYMLEWYYRR